VGRPRYRWVNIKMNFAEIRLCGMESVHLAENRDQWKAVTNAAMTLNAEKFLGVCTIGVHWRRSQLRGVGRY
jgi:hypothetical protein